LLDRFESLGDNWEFGFVQRQHGLEGRALLRWAIAPTGPIITALDHLFTDFYLLDELAPSSDGMVLATRHGLNFHSSLRSKMESGQREFVADQAIREELYQAEVAKMYHLHERLGQGRFIFVYIADKNVGEEESRKLYATLQRFNEKNQRLVVMVDAALPPTRRLEEGLYFGYKERIAPYEQAGDASYDRWLKLCSDAVVLSAEEQTG
jgi:hypothetical protein